MKSGDKSRNRGGMGLTVEVELGLGGGLVVEIKWKVTLNWQFAMASGRVHPSLRWASRQS